MIDRREGGCRCGAVRYVAEGEAGNIVHCHCMDCRRTSGAPFVTWVEVPASGYRLLDGSPGSYVARPGTTRTFCRDCGTQLTFRDEMTPQAVDVTAGSLDGWDDLRPSRHLWCIRLAPWLTFADGLPRHDRRSSG